MLDIPLGKIYNNIKGGKNKNKLKSRKNKNKKIKKMTKELQKKIKWLNFWSANKYLKLLLFFLIIEAMIILHQSGILVMVR